MTGLRETIADDMRRERTNGPEALAMILLLLTGIACVITLTSAAIDENLWLFALAIAAILIVYAGLLRIGDRVDLREYRQHIEPVTYKLGPGDQN